MAKKEALRCEDGHRRTPIGGDEGLRRTVGLVHLCHGIGFGGVLDAATVALETGEDGICI